MWSVYNAVDRNDGKAPYIESLRSNVLLLLKFDITEMLIDNFHQPDSSFTLYCRDLSFQTISFPYFILVIEQLSIRTPDPWVPVLMRGISYKLWYPQPKDGLVDLEWKITHQAAIHHKNISMNGNEVEGDMMTLAHLTISKIFGCFCFSKTPSTNWKCIDIVIKSV